MLPISLNDNRISGINNFIAERKIALGKLVPIKTKNKLDKELSIKSNLSISQLLLISHSKVDFLIIESGTEMDYIYEFYEDRMFKIGSYDHRELNTTQRISRLEYTIKRIQYDIEKPLFITGIPSSEIKQIKGISLCNSGFTGYSEVNRQHHINSLSTSIASNWKYWHKITLLKNIKSAEEKGAIITKIEKISDALEHKVNGLLITNNNAVNEIERIKRNPIHTRLIINLEKQLEGFLNRGNKIECIDDKYLQDTGGIVLIPEMHRSNWENNAPTKRIKENEVIY